MKKLLLLLTTLFIAFLSVQAGQGGPDAYGYTWIDSQEPGGPVYNWLDIANPVDGIQVLGLGDDNVVGPFQVSNGTFQYYWYNVDRFWIGSNGYIAFNQVNIASPFPAIPTSGGPNDFIAGIMADLKFDGVGNNAECWISKMNDTTVISYINVPFWDLTPAQYSGLNSFQIILDNSDSSIYVNVQQQTGIGFQLQCSLGIENLSGAVGLQHSFNAFPPINYTIKYEYPSMVTYQVTDGKVNWNDQEDNKGVFVPAGGSALDLQTNIGNSGNQQIPSFTATGTIINNLGSNVLTTTATVPPLSPGADTTLMYPSTWTPGSQGHYTFRTTISGVPGDLVPTNNSIDREIVAVDTNQTAIVLDYTDGISTGSLSWNGGNGGVAMYFAPPTYPAEIVSASFYHTTNLNNSSFAAMLYRDDGPNGTRGTLLDSVYVPAASIILNGYTNVTFNTPALIPDSGVYVLWRMDGDGLNIGTTTNGPISRHAYEVLDGTWAAYRQFDTEDFIISLTYEPQFVEDIGASSIISPLGSITSPSLVSVYLRNFGQTIVNQFDINYQLSGGPIVTETYNGSGIAPNDSIQYTFQNLMSLAPGSGDLCIWTSSSAIADANSGNDTTCTAITIPISLTEEEDVQVQLYPNPASDRITVNGTNAKETFEMELYDVQGKKVGHYYLPPGVNTTVDVSSLPAGSYFYRLHGGTKDTMGTIVIR